MKTFMYFIILLTTAGFLQITGCKTGKASEKKSNTSEQEVLPDNIVELSAEQSKLANIELGSTVPRVVSGIVKATGVLAVGPQSLASVCAPMGGFIKSTDLVPGSPVRKGQQLAIIENQEFINIQQNYFESKNRFEYAEAEYKRHSELYKDDVYSAKNLQQVTTDYKILKAQVHALEQKLRFIGLDPTVMKEDNITSSVAIVSPINGYIRTASVNTGKYVTSTDVMFEIINSDKLFLELNLFEKDIDKIAAGQKISFFINNEPETHLAIISQIGKSVSNDKTCKVYAPVTEPCKNMMQGMYVNALIESSGKMVTSLPSQAIVSFDDKDYIFTYERSKQENGKPFTEYRMVEIHKGASLNGYTEVMLPDGFDATKAKIVIRGAYNLLSAKKNAGEMSC
jgi:membrane fusion protein, heavy metal efflux system